MKPTTRTQEEQKAIHRILNGDTAQFAVLIGRYQRPVYTLIFRITGNSYDAEELTQDCFLKAYSALGRFRATSSFSTWLFRIAYNTAISATRRIHRELHGIDERRLAGISDDAADALFASHDEELLEALTRAMEQLAAEEQALLHLFYYDAHPIGVCAEISGLSEANVKVRLHRIRKKLYILMTDSNGTE